MDPIYTEIAPGELIDKITVLEIKTERIGDPARLKNVETELTVLQETRDKHMPDSSELKELSEKLKAVNEEIWDLGDKIREFGEQKDFGKEFTDVAWRIHLVNDDRAAFKKQINLMMDSRIIEEKSYKHWK